MKILKQTFSLDEERVSSLVIALFITLGFGLWDFVMTKSFDDNILTLIECEILAITGLNVTDKINKKKKTNMINDEVVVGE